MKAILYCRVSTVDQAEKGQSIEAQTEKLKSYAIANGFRDYEVITENGTIRTGRNGTLQWFIKFGKNGLKTVTNAVLTIKLSL